MAGLKVFLLTALWITAARTQYRDSYYYQTPTGYQYSWAVQDAPSYNNYRHEESSDGQVVKGFYQVLLPDGRIQTVKYHVEGDSGFVADVTYEGGFDYQAPKAAAPSAPSAPSASFAPSAPSAPYGARQYAVPTYPTYTQTYPHYEAVYQAPAYPKSYYPPPDYYAPYDPEEPATAAPEPEPSPTDPVDIEEVTVAPPPVTTTAAPQFDYGSPLYRIDYYSARAKSSGYTTPEPYGDEDKIDRDAFAYIKPHEALAIPDKLGTYEVDHRKATARKPSLVPQITSDE